MNAAKCKGCGGPIYWVRTVAGKNMPVDRDAIRIVVGKVSNKERLVVVTADGRTLSGRGTDTPSLFEEDSGAEVAEGYTPHWATCPARQRFRKETTG